MNWLRLISGRRSRKMTLSFLGLALGATAWSLVRKRKRTNPDWINGIRNWLR